MKRLHLISLVSVGILLSGCSTTFDSGHGFFRNREMDYRHNPVSERPNLIFPKGVSAPTLKPRYTLPKGQNQYPAQQGDGVLPPPGFDSVIHPGKAKSAHTAEAQPSESWVGRLFSNPDAEKKQQAIQKLKDTITQIQDELANSKHPHNAKNTTPAKHLVSNVTFDHNIAGLLRINAPFNLAWTRIQSAIAKTSYTVTKTNKGSGLIYVSNQKNHQPSNMLYAYYAGGTTKVSVFTLKGKLDNSTNAYSLLEQISGNLN